jgi:hypothetical protein
MWRSDCCARAVRGHATAAPPSSVINSRRLIASSCSVEGQTYHIVADHGQNGNVGSVPNPDSLLLTSRANEGLCGQPTTGVTGEVVSGAERVTNRARFVRFLVGLGRSGHEHWSGCATRCSATIRPRSSVSQSRSVGTAWVIECVGRLQQSFRQNIGLEVAPVIVKRSFGVGTVERSACERENGYIVRHKRWEP